MGTITGATYLITLGQGDRQWILGNQMPLFCVPQIAGFPFSVFTIPF